MAIYRPNDRRRHYPTPGFMETSKGGISQLKPGGQSYAEKYRHSPYINKASTPVMNSLNMVSPYVDFQSCFTLENSVPAVMQPIDESKMTAMARHSLKRDNFRIQGWRVRKLGGGIGNPVSVGLYRFEGIGIDRNEWLDWSIILKVIQSPANLGYENMGEGDDQAHWNFWKRELMLYQSGLLESLPEGITSPHFYAAEELPGNLAALWLEDVNDSFSGAWPLYRYALTARHLGRLNGIYISRRELPSYPWLSLNRTRQWLASMPWRDFPWEHPYVAQYYPGGEKNSFRALLQEHRRFLSRLERLPQTVSHGDTFPTNFRSRRIYRGQEQTVAIDWAQAGIAPIGDDLGQLVYGTSLNLKGYRLQDISQMLLTSYINGLQDSGCRINPDLVRFGYVASAAFRIGLFKLSLLKNEIDKDDSLFHHSSSPPVTIDSFESLMAEEAFRLMEII